MTSQQNVSSMSLAVRVVRIALSVLGCLVFLFSMMLPFYLLDYPDMSFPIYSDSSTYYWSFRSLNSRVSFPTEPPTNSPMVTTATLTDNWFLDCWFHDFFIDRLGLSKILITMFAVQILTLITGIASIFVKKSLFALVPTTLCFTVILMMIHTSVTLVNLCFGHSSTRLLACLSLDVSVLVFLYSKYGFQKRCEDD
jgi:hypothetical protein